MADLDSRVVGKRIADARGRAGLTQAELAAAISLDRSALTKVENGSRRVSALELARIADALDERVEWFVAATPEAIVSHRNLAEPGAASPAVDRIVERISRNVEFLAEHDDRLMPAAAAPCLPRPGTVADAERMAVRARELLSVHAEEPLLDLAARVAGIGLLAFSWEMGDTAADAASILLAAGGVALVNGSLAVGRRRLALAHELGHYVFADEYAVDWNVAEREDGDAWESRLDRFARAVLLPAGGLGDMWARLRADGDDLRTMTVKVASAYRVDMTTLARRLRELGHVDQSGMTAIRSFRTTKADIVEFDLLVCEELRSPALPRRYEESVLRLYRNEIIAAVGATDLLLDTWNEDDLPVLPPLPENHIWKSVS
jgi:Zn-dependent peptidase ImmA (M78 family)/DNA-binding XRE family transcriptional regulator